MKGIALKWGGFLLGVIIFAMWPRPVGAVDVQSDEVVMCGGVFGLRDFGGWRDGWGNHMTLCGARPRCVNGTLDITIAFKPRTTGIPMVKTDEHLLLAGIDAGISAGPQTIHVTFARQVIRRVNGAYRIVQQRVSCKDRVFRGVLTNVWVLWAVQP